jgi:hypothetical protein
MNKDDIELLEDLFLLAMLNKEPNETLDNISQMLVETKSLNFNEAKKIVTNLKIKGAIIDNSLSFLGISLANKAKEKFKLK